jgi:predicted transcriptional regulator
MNDTITVKGRINFLRQTFEENPEFFHKLPKSEQDLFVYHVIKKIDQREIARLLGVTQGAISSRMKRIRTRFLFMKEINSFNTENLENDLSKIFNPLEIEILKSMLTTTCQSETARRINVIFKFKKEHAMSQVKIRHRFCKCLTKLSKTHEGSQAHYYFELFSLINKNLYKLHEVRLPHFTRGFR